MGIDRLRPEQIDEVAGLASRCFEGAGAWSASDLAAELERSFAEVWIASQDGEALGYAVAWFLGEQAELLSVGTDPAARGKGIGSALVARIQRSAEERAVRSLTLEVRRDNGAARAVYERAGFTTVSARPRYYADGEDALLMAWSPPP